MADKPAFGVFPQMKPRRSQQDREAAKNVPVDLARGFVSGTLGAPGDIEALARLPYELITGNESPTILPTSADIEKRLPFKSDTPVSRAATGLGQLGGGAYTGPLSGVRAVTSIPKAVVQAGKDFVMAAPQGAPRMFIGPKAKTWDQAKADAAARMEKEGVDPVEIWRETKTFRGADGIQRQEINDQSARFLSNVERKERAELIESQIMGLKEQIKPSKQKDLFPKALTEAKKGARERIDRAKDAAWEYKKLPIEGVEAHSIFEHPELYRAYPELADVKIAAGGYGGDSKGALTAFPGAPGHGQPGIMEIDIFDRALKSDPRSTALHEMQHAVQTLEGMSPGGNITMAFQDPKAFDVLEEIRKRALTPMTFDEYAAKLSHIDPSELSKSYGKYVASIPEMVKNMDRELQSQAALEYYKRLAGEAEARATQFRREMTPEQRAEEYPYSSYDVPEESLIAKPAKEFAEGGEVKMDKGGAAFGVFPQAKGKRSKQDREAAKTFPIDVARGFVSGALGMPGDLEGLARLLMNIQGPDKFVMPRSKDEAMAMLGQIFAADRVSLDTKLPTSEDIEKRLPFKSDSPLSQAATGLGQIGGGFYTGPLSGARAMTAIPKAVGKAGKDFVMAAGQPAVNVVKPKGGNFLTDRLGYELQHLKRYDLPDLFPEFGAPPPNSPANEAINNWVDRNLTNYIKNQMATPEDPVRLMLDKRTAEIEAKFAKDMERADKLAERAAAELDPRMKANLTRNAEEAKTTAQRERDLAMSHMLPSQEVLMGTSRQAAGESRVNRAVEGFPEEGMAQSPAGKAWENITDSDMGVSANRAGDAQSAVEKKQKTEEALVAFRAKEPEINEAFIKMLVERGLKPSEIQNLNKALSARHKLDLLENPNLSDEYERLSKAVETQNIFKDKDLYIAQNYPWVSKLDPETRLYEFYGSHDLGFDHIIDVLKQDVAAGRITPEQLNRMSVDQAVRRAAEYDKELAEKMNSARAAAREGLPVYKEYPEGYRWIELNKPGSFSSESEAMGHSVRGYEPPKGHPDWMEGSGDSGSEYYGHGGWEGIKSGRAKVYSLVDPKGAPHVTVEQKAGKPWNERSGIFYDNPELEPSWRRFSTEASLEDKAKGLNRPSNYIERYPEWLKANEPEMFAKYSKVFEQESPVITQIKGKQNTRPNEKYDQYTQDFVKSGQWSDVRDLENTGLRRHKSSEGDKYLTEDEYLQEVRKELGLNPDEGMKRGGAVSISDNADAQMMEVEDKKMAGGGEVRMGGGGDADKAAFGVFPQMKPRRSKQDTEAAKDVPKDVLRGFVAGAIGAPSDIANIPSDIYSLVTGEEGYKVPYGSEHWKETLPLPPTSSVGKAAQEMGGLAGGVYTGPGAPIRVVASIPGALKHGALEFAKASAEAAPRVYRPHTPLKPDPNVGTRYKVSDKGGLAPKKDLDIESLQNSQVKIFPWDATSRNKLVTEVSDVPLKKPVLTEGGDDYMRDLRHIEERIAGASNLGIAKRIMDRVNEAAVENQMLGSGTGKVFGFSSRMGEGAEMASTFPTDIAMNLVKQAKLTQDEVKALDENMRNMAFDGKKGIFKDMAKFGSKEFVKQLRKGLDSDKKQDIQGFSAMNMRKAFMDRMGMVENQKRLGFNLPDLSNAVLADELKGVPKGYVGNAAAELDVFGKLRPSKSSTYDTDFPGVYAGSMPNMPVELLMPQTFENIYREMKALYPNAKPEALRNMVVGAMEKRSKGISEKIGQRNIDAVKTYQEGLAKGEFDPNDIKQVYDFMRRKKLELKMAGGGAVDNGLIKVKNKRKARG